METYTPRRNATIPRPWLSKKRQPLEPHNVDILDKPKWNVSWSKLLSCFCIKEQSTEKAVYNERSFPQLPAIRRYSSCSFSSYGDDDSGSVSSFTDSDTFSYSTEDDVESSKPKQPPPRASTPPPAPIAKPPIVSARSRSAGLPPLNPCPSITTPQPPMNRSRCDTGDNTRTSATTNTSKHRRNGHFQFSTHSMEQIWRGTNERVIPPSFVLCEDMNIAHLRSDSGLATTSMDTHDYRAGSYSWAQSWAGSSQQTGKNDDDDEESSSPFAQLERKATYEAWGGGAPPGRGYQIEGKPREDRPMQNEVAVENFEYMPKSRKLDVTDGNLLLSGWIAVSVSGMSLVHRLQQGCPLLRDDIFYLRIIEQNGRALILLQKDHGHVDHSLLLHRDWMCSPVEVSSRVGRCVVLRSATEDIATLLPVSLGGPFFSSGRLVPEKEFSRMRSRLFVGGKGKVFAPDAQHDAATHILFSLDALIKKRGV